MAESRYRVDAWSRSRTSGGQGISPLLKRPMGLVDADGGALVVEVDDRSANAVQVAGAGVVIDADAVTDTELSERLG